MTVMGNLIYILKMITTKNERDVGPQNLLNDFDFDQKVNGAGASSIFRVNF
jgi:hypothetical protein